MTAAAAATQQHRARAVFLLGFALSGFFDGILLHQILQWHHLFLGWQAGPLRDMRVQLAADGLFHLLMYALVLVALALLWRARGSGADVSARRMAVPALLGFGAWHVLDGVVSHWVLGIHRIRMDSPDPLFWDLLWFGAFGVVPLVIGWALARGAPPRPGHGGAALASALAALSLALGTVAALPPRDADTILVVLRPGADLNRVLDTVQSLQGGMVWVSRGGGAWAFRLRKDADYGAFYAAGALFVTASPAVLGCLSWSRAGTSAS